MGELAEQTTRAGQAAAVSRYRDELIEEWQSILAYWANNMVDGQYGGFYGSIGHENVIDPAAPKGIVLNSRILWTFSSAYSFTQDPLHRKLADRAAGYILRHFIDQEYGGVYWSVDHMGNRLESRKQVYGLAFAIYGLAEYHKATGNEAALAAAKQLFEQIEQQSRDREKGGYIEAFTREWEPLADLRLSEKDDNERKTMNTHLHIIEAYANLYQVWPDAGLRSRIDALLEIFDRYIINHGSGHLHLFMDEDWQVRSSLQSFGHDIEAAWLLQECAEIIHSQHTDRFRKYAVRLADAAAEGLDNDGGLWYEYDPGKDHWAREKHWWPQAEAMVGFFNAWELTGAEHYLQQSLQCWDFVKQHIRDSVNGEWHWGVYADYSQIKKEKAGFWKCPYHNSRACMEIIKRIAHL